MTRTGTPCSNTGTRANWTQQALSSLTVTGGLPEVAGLAEALAAACQGAAADRAAAVALPAPGAGQLEAGWDTVRPNCLFRSGCRDEAVWQTQPQGWQLEGKSAGITTGTGNGAWPEDVPLPEIEGPWAWQELVMCLSEQPVLAVRIFHAADLAEEREIEDQLRQLRDGLRPLLELWSTTRRLDAQLSQARTENQALGRLSSLQDRAVAMASHEFKTPLTSITAYSDALRSQITDAEFPHATEFLGVIRSEAGRLLRMVNRILDFSRLGAGLELLETRPEALGPLVTGAIPALRPALAAKGLELQIDVPDDLPRAEVDADMVRQVLVNLLSNAVKYTPAGGRITVTLEEVAAAVRIRVADTGVGIPEADLQRIFREFYRPRSEAHREEGTGLGLTIVRHILNLHGGCIHVRRRRGGGTEFACDLPKEVVETAPLPLEFSGRTDRAQAWRLISLVTYLAAELTGSLAVSLNLRDGRGGRTQVAALGCGKLTAGQERWLAAELKTAEGSLGALRVGRPLPEADHGPLVARQLQIIAELAALALSYLTDRGPGEEGASSTVQAVKVTEALRAVQQISRSGVPTSTDEALELLRLLGREMGVGEENIHRLQFAALLHDAGMARVEVEIVMGESELTWDQRDEVERHVEQGLELMSPLLLDRDIAKVIRHHHERVDGKGYPDGLSHQEIPLGARMLAVVDTWFALTRERTFRPGLATEKALAEIRNHAGTQFDPQVVGAFAKVLEGEGILCGSPAGTRN